MANIGLISALASRHDTILYDQLVHASIREGIRLSLATSYPFKHNDLSNLEAKLDKAQGKTFILVEALYSMDGDQAPLAAIAQLAETYNAYLIIDEAHSNGVLGPEGRGLVLEHSLQNYCLARVHTFGKALGSHGAAVLGSSLLREYLTNFSRPFIYTTGLPVSSLIAIQKAYQYLPTLEQERATLNANIAYLKAKLQEHNQSWNWVGLEGPICGLVFGSEDITISTAQALHSKGLDARPILAPTVPPGTERIRICLHNFNAKNQIDQFINTLA
jgi:8-amino-7-oxononanoate synthase